MKYYLVQPFRSGLCPASFQIALEEDDSESAAARALLINQFINGRNIRNYVKLTSVVRLLLAGCIASVPVPRALVGNPSFIYWLQLTRIPLSDVDSGVKPLRKVLDKAAWRDYVALVEGEKATLQEKP